MEKKIYIKSQQAMDVIISIYICIVKSKKLVYSNYITCGGVDLVIEIEYYKGDILLEGKTIAFHTFQSQIADIERDYDREEDNFTALLCRRFHYEPAAADAVPQFVYDRDTVRAYRVTFTQEV